MTFRAPCPHKEREARMAVNSYQDSFTCTGQPTLRSDVLFLGELPFRSHVTLRRSDMSDGSDISKSPPFG